MEKLILKDFLERLPNVSGENYYFIYYGELHLLVSVLPVVKRIFSLKGVACTLRLKPYVESKFLKEMEVKGYDIDDLMESGKLTLMDECEKSICEKDSFAMVMQEWCEQAKRNGFHTLVHLSQVVVGLHQVGPAKFKVMENQLSENIFGLPMACVCYYPFDYFFTYESGEQAKNYFTGF